MTDEKKEKDLARQVKEQSGPIGEGQVGPVMKLNPYALRSIGELHQGNVYPGDISAEIGHILEALKKVSLVHDLPHNMAPVPCGSGGTGSVPPPPRVFKNGEEFAASDYTPEFPCIVKIVNSASGMGIHFCFDEEEYQTVKEGLQDEKGKITVEKFLGLLNKQEPGLGEFAGGRNPFSGSTPGFGLAFGRKCHIGNHLKVPPVGILDLPRILELYKQLPIGQVFYIKIRIGEDSQDEELLSVSDRPDECTEEALVEFVADMVVIGRDMKFVGVVDLKVSLIKCPDGKGQIILLEDNPFYPDK